MSTVKKKREGALKVAAAMAEMRVNGISLAVFLMCVAFGSWMLTMSPVDPGWILLGAAIVGATHLITVPAPSGEWLYLGIGAATAVPFLVHDYATFLAILTLGMATAWGVFVAKRRNDELAGSHFLARNPEPDEFQ